MASKRQKLHLIDDFTERLARSGLSLRAFAQQAALNYSTLHGLTNPESQPTRRGGGGGMYPKTAWKIAAAYAHIADLTPDEAFATIIVERQDDPTSA